MQVRYLIIVAICGLLMGQCGVESVGLLPLPAQVDRAQQIEAGSEPQAQAAAQAGEVQFLNPKVILTADNETVNSVDMTAPPTEVKYPFDFEIVKKKGDSPPASGGVVPPASDQQTSKVPIVTKEGKRIGEGKLILSDTRKRANNKQASTTTKAPFTCQEKTCTNSSSRIDTSLFPTIISLAATILMLSLARK